jgi:hypothetical protein
MSISTRQELRRVLAALRSSPPVEPPRWQPIETAPKGRIVLMFGVTDVDKHGTVRNWKKATGNVSFDGDSLTWDGDRIDKPYQPESCCRGILRGGRREPVVLRLWWPASVRYVGAERRVEPGDSRERPA